MASQVNPPRGMRDFLPQEKAQRNQVLQQILTSYIAHGFQEIETPALEQIERLTAGQGGDNEKLAYRVLKRGDELSAALASGEVEQLSDLGLRYDLTVPLTRFYATNRSKLTKPLKAIQIGPVWRAERPQKGRFRQFVQCDIDIIGDSGIVAEAELLVASLDALEAIGLTNAVVRINHRQLLQLALSELGIASDLSADAMIIIDKLDKLGVDGVCEELAERFNQDVASRAKTWLIGSLTDNKVPSVLAELFEAVQSIHPNRLRFDPTLVRGMGYYTGVIFEIEHPDSGSAIGGGGRYDGMVGNWIGEDVPAVGISIGFERVMELLADRPDGFESLVVVFEVENLVAALKIQREGIARGLAVRLEQKPKKLNNLLDSLKEQGFQSFALVEGGKTSLAELEIRAIS